MSVTDTELKNMMMAMSATLNRIDARTESHQTMTEYDKELLNYGYIDKDINAINSAPDIAVFLFEQMKMENLKPEILQRYKYKGGPFTLDTARKAVTFAKTKK
jgi:hypothetical protein